MLLTLHLLLCLLPGLQGACALPCQLPKACCLIIIVRNLRSSQCCRSTV